MTYTETALTLIRSIDRILSEHPGLDASTGTALDSLDQFHIGGADAVERLIPALALAEEDAVLDIGSGFGGPARQIARRTGNRVLGIDITPAYVQAARHLTEKAGLAGLVAFEACDITAVPTDRPFQAAICVHVQMNVHDKAAWFAQIGRRLEPGARLAVWEVCGAGGRDLAWPMPWSLDGTDSHIVDASTLRTTVERAGFSTLDWTDDSAWVRDWIATTLAAGPPAGPALPMLLDDGYSRVLHYADALTRGALQVWRGCFSRNPTP
jgi:SAM-dependent methyltransferase